jgi:hypothetical protein
MTELKPRALRAAAINTLSPPPATRGGSAAALSTPPAPSPAAALAFAFLSFSAAASNESVFLSGRVNMTRCSDTS